MKLWRRWQCRRFGHLPFPQYRETDEGWMFVGQTCLRCDQRI